MLWKPKVYYTYYGQGNETLAFMFSRIMCFTLLGRPKTQFILYHVPMLNMTCPLPKVAYFWYSRKALATSIAHLTSQLAARRICRRWASFPGRRCIFCSSSRAVKTNKAWKTSYFVALFFTHSPLNSVNLADRAVAMSFTLCSANLAHVPDWRATSPSEDPKSGSNSTPISMFENNWQLMT